jgi:general secretion pathway protein D
MTVVASIFRSLGHALLVLALGNLAACDLPLHPPSGGVSLPEPVGRSIGNSAPTPLSFPPVAQPSDDAVIHTGTGIVVQATAPAAGAPPQAGERNGDVTLNFIEADIREVLRSVLGDVLHLNYVVDSKVQAAITVQTSRPLRKEDVLPTLQQVLRASGLVLVETSGVYRVVPVEEAARNGAAPVSLGQGSGRPRFDAASVNVQILPLRFAAAAEILRTVEPFLPKGAVLEADAVRNVLVLSGPGQDLATVLDLVKTFDVDWLSGMSYGIVPLQTGSARAIVDELNVVFGPGGSVPLAGVLRVAPLERMNAILVVSPQRSYIDEARSWIARFDRGDDENTPQVFQYHVENSRAVDLAKVLTALISGGQGHNGSQPQTAPGTTPSEIGGPTGSGGGNSASLLPAAQASTTPAPGSAAATGLPQLGGAAAAPQRAETADSAGGGGFGGAGNALGPGGGGPEFPQLRVVADERNNTLLIYARPRIYRMIEESLKKLDVAPLQVLIEATIAEVTLTDDLQFGLQFLLKPGSSGGVNNTIGFSNLSTGTVAPAFPGFNAALGFARANVVLNALKAITNVKVISSPQLLVLDRGVATLQVGDQVPILTAQVQSTITTGAPVVNTIDYRDTGVILRVAPRVNSNGQIQLDVAQEVSDVTKTTTSGIDAPTFNRRRIESTVMVQDGETIALGGLIKDNKSFTRNGIPILSDMPVLGALFRSDDDSKTRTELLILLSPKVVRNAQEAHDVTEELRRRLRGLQPVGPTVVSPSP